ncbi:hypothetical protein GCM10018791_60060 [Streptomyces zaomyceticus]|nr:hypothetical protein GCM10018791_60060 [Streptomyces zaomyceticus]
MGWYGMAAGTGPGGAGHWRRAKRNVSALPPGHEERGADLVGGRGTELYTQEAVEADGRHEREYGEADSPAHDRVRNATALAPGRSGRLQGGRPWAGRLLATHLGVGTRLGSEGRFAK